MAEINCEELCRICLKESYFYSNVFTEELDDGSHFVDVVNDLLQLDMEFEDGYPQSICSECYNKITDFEVFKRSAHEGRAVLFYSKGNVGNDEIKLEHEFENAGEYVPFQNEIYLVPAQKEDCDTVLIDRDPLKTVMKSEDETDEYGNFSPVNNEMYLGEGVLENNESLPIPRDPLEIDVEQKMEDPLHLDKGHELDLEVSRFPVHVAHSEKNRFQMTLRHRDKEKKHIYEENEIHYMGTTDGNDVQQKGRIKLMHVSLMNENSEGSSMNDDETEDGFIFGDSLTMLKIHERMREKPFKCKFCPKRFNRSSHQRIHERVHTGEKPYRCKFCQKNFSQTSSLKTHVRVHTGEKPYKCKYCEKRFNTRGNMKQHVTSCIKTTMLHARSACMQH